MFEDDEEGDMDNRLTKILGIVHGFLFTIELDRHDINGVLYRLAVPTHSER